MAKLIGFAFVALWCAVVPAEAADSLRGIGRACAAETARFCPALSASTPAPRNQYICLKPFKTSLSLNCRAAVSAYGSR